jgi:hypothetical protein
MPAAQVSGGAMHLKLPACAEGTRMTKLLRGLLATTLTAAPVAVAEAESLLRPGAYQVEVQLELPNVLSWSPQRVATICLPAGEGGAPFPVLSMNNPLAGCAVSDIRRNGAHVTFNLACSGRGSAVAWASYILKPHDDDRSAIRPPRWGV